MSEPGKGRGCFKIGCIGCLVVVGAPLLVGGVLLVLSLLFSGGPPRVEPVALARTVEGPGLVEPGAAGRPGQPPVPAVAEPGRIVLALSTSEFEIVPGPPGGEIRVDGRYDASAYALEESYESYGETGWIYRLRFGRRGFLPKLFRADPETNRLRLTIPRDLPVVLEGKVGLGESVLDLSGLWLLEINLELGIGEHEIRFDDPLVAPMGLFRVAASVGEVRLLGLGNASPESIEVSQSIGETFVDLTGVWRRDARVSVRCGIGECRVGLPDDVGFEVERGGVLLGDSSIESTRRLPPTPGAPTLTLSVSGKLGEVSIE